ncbi:GH1 family beta-glucosidase [Streptomyces sp. NPDC047046]|uniref:GH1 family beta-glucosidase n=1 Tax=Streptomyces sp. NPDC047046 TaxID=3155378 RepID=UPI0033C43F08
MSTAPSRTTPYPTFPPGFRFGAATAAYQIEGAHDEDGRGPSIWDTFSHTPGRTEDGASGDVACDHYHRWPEDVALLAGLGVDAYRFSVAWPRVLPKGTGAVNAKGLDFYDRLTDALLDAGISPTVTLYHWDLPQTLEDRGGWRERATAEHFAAYAAVVAERLGDRVGSWITLNEPYCTAFNGYAEGRHAPGAREGVGALAAAHHLLLAHGLGTEALRAAGAREVGITLNLDRVEAASGHPDDLAALRRARTLHNDVWTDPLFAGRYPEHERETWGPLAEGLAALRREDDLRVIGAPLDFLGLNYYRPLTVRAAPHRENEPRLRTAVDIGAAETDPYGTRHTTMGWPVVPEALPALLRELTARHPGLPPLRITENGSAEADTVAPDGAVHDADRVHYLDTHLTALATAIEEGADVREYYAWSLLDNFEWARGYEQRFGLVRVDYASGERLPKDSYHWYAGLLAHHRARTTISTTITASTASTDQERPA